MALSYSVTTDGGPVEVRCLSSDTKPTGQANWTVKEVDTGKTYTWSSSGWTETVSVPSIASVMTNDQASRDLLKAIAEHLFDIKELLLETIKD